MSTSRSKPNPKRRGFTLMEVMVVVCIMASLAALVATNVFGVKADADQKTTRLAIHTAEGALDLFRLQKGHQLAGIRFAATEVPIALLALGLAIFFNRRAK
jgi:prepilin-type N-terminal cleavage/methylation domain-containing protein